MPADLTLLRHLELFPSMQETTWFTGGSFRFSFFQNQRGKRYHETDMLS